MFPTPIQKRPFFNQVSYKILVPLSLAIWLVPLVGIMMTSIRGLGDITAGNLWGAPSEFLFFSNMADVFQNTPMLTEDISYLDFFKEDTSIINSNNTPDRKIEPIKILKPSQLLFLKAFKHRALSKSFIK